MTRFLSQSRLILLSLALLSVIVGCGVIPTNEPQVRTQLVTVEIIITATPDPRVTSNVIVVTATPNRQQVNVPDGLVPTDDGTADTDSQSVASADLTPLDSADNDEAVGENLPENCIIHIVEEGDFVFSVALEYEVDPFTTLAANGLTEETATSLQIGDELIIPLEGCPVEELANLPTETPLPSDTPDVSSTPTSDASSTPIAATSTPTPNISPTPTVSPTITLPPTATDAQVEIAGVINAGDVTAEGVRIVNPGSIIRIDGWSLRDADGNEYRFTEQILFSNSELTLFTRGGQDTPIARFWGLEEPIWQVGDVVTLVNARGQVQAAYRIPANE